MSHHRTALAIALALLALPATAQANACRPTTTEFFGLPSSTDSSVITLGPNGLVGGGSTVGGVPPEDIDGRTATVWAGQLQHRVGQFLDGLSSEFFGSAQTGIYVGDGSYSGTFQSGATPHAAISVAGLGALRTVTPLSGNPRDASNLLDAKLEDGDVTVAGTSTAADGSDRGTVWTCALRQSFVPGRNLLH